MRPLVKICGLTRAEDAELAVALGADLLGVVLWPASPRAVGLDRVREIAAAVAGRVPLVGVFVDARPEEIAAALAAGGLDLAQLHGSEPVAWTAALGGRAIRALRPEADHAAAMAALPAAWGFVVDTGDARRHGGTGERWAWRRLPRPGPGQRLLVAGGIRPGNVRAALAATGADGIDVASGVEARPGVKDSGLLAQLFAEVGDGAMEERA